MISSPLQAFEDFWGHDSSSSMKKWFEVRFNRELSENMASALRWIPLMDYMKMGGVWEISEYYGLPLPAEAKPEGIRKILDEKFLDGWKRSEEVWKIASMEESPDNVEAFSTEFRQNIEDCKEYHEQAIKKLKKIADALVPYVMHAYESKLEQARVRALYGIVLLQIKSESSYLRGFTASAVIFQQSLPSLQ